MLTRALLTTLHCPYCGSPLVLDKDLSPGQETLAWGIARCHCYRYAILDSILILQQYSPANSTDDALIDYLDAGDCVGALAYAISTLSPVSGPRPALQKLVTILGKRGGPLGRMLSNWRTAQARALAESSPTLREALYAFRPSLYADYLFYRTANPSFLASLPLISVFDNLSGGVVLDLACGIGHSSYLIGRSFPHLHVVAADHDFLNLYIAKRFIAPDATLICLSTEAPLPFADRALSGVWCLDGMHYVRAKAALGQELRRVTRPDGVWVFPHLHNALSPNPNAGIPLPPEDYRRCFGGMEPRLFVEADILRLFTQAQELDLTASAAEQALGSAPVICLVASANEATWRRYPALAQTLADAGPLALNPIYAARDGDSDVQLEMAWPSAELEAECRAVTHIIPEHPSLDRGLLGRLRSRRLEDADRPVIERLVARAVILPLPPGYL
ncbi:MAG: class I SAM-dependent methyltransferase [Anaerolineae bacterium]|nr:class I SAM-dependent methyltransferase [Anaerolineae bacterium]